MVVAVAAAAAFLLNVCVFTYTCERNKSVSEKECHNLHCRRYKLLLTDLLKNTLPDDDDYAALSGTARHLNLFLQ